jgi:hypothetical protein
MLEIREDIKIMNLLDFKVKLDAPSCCPATDVELAELCQRATASRRERRSELWARERHGLGPWPLGRDHSFHQHG